MYGNTYPAFYYFVVQKQITPAEYQVVEYDNETLELSRAEAQKVLSMQLARYQQEWKILCIAYDVDDAYDIINRAVDVDEMLIGNAN